MQMTLFQIPATTPTKPKKQQNAPKIQSKITNKEEKQQATLTQTATIPSVIQEPIVEKPKTTESPKISKVTENPIEEKYQNYKEDLTKLLAIIEDLLEKNL